MILLYEECSCTLVDFDGAIDLAARVSMRDAGMTRTRTIATFRKNQKEAKKPMVPVTKKKPNENNSLKNTVNTRSG